MQCSKVRAEIAATAERNGRKCRHVYVVINPDLQAQDQPKGKQKKRKKWKFIQSAIVFFFPFRVLPLLRFGSQQQQMPDKHIFLPRLSSVQPGHFFSSTCHKTRETTMSVRLWTDVRRIVMIGTFLWTHHVFVCLFSFLLLLLLKNNINARHGGGDYIGERLCVSSWPPIFLSIFLKKKNK